jgi:hypothetical protein
LQERELVYVEVRHTWHHALICVKTPIVPDTGLVVFLNGSCANFATLQSRAHEIWARFFSSSLEDRLRYAPSDCFETFPFPQNFDTNIVLETAGKRYLDHRAALMIENGEGTTKTYNRFHDQTENAAGVARLRDLHADMDRAVLSAYGWHDLAVRAEPVFLTDATEHDHTYQGRLFWPSDFRDEVLARLLTLNAERHAEEMRAGLAREGTRMPDVDEPEEDEGDEPEPA